MATIDSFKGDYSFLSNFYPSEVKYGDIIYPTVEHGFQAAKSMKDIDRVWIQKMISPAAAKRAGRSLKLRDDWKAVKDGIMLELLRTKFTIPSLAIKLESTGDAILIEGNYWGDIYWGVCRGIGENKLGKLLMQVRDEITKLDERDY